MAVGQLQSFVRRVVAGQGRWVPQALATATDSVAGTGRKLHNKNLRRP